MIVLNDVHLGVTRAAGTTPQSSYALRQRLLTQFEEALYSVNEDLMIDGDLFDGPDIPRVDMLQTFRVLSDWLTRTSKILILVNGNHDLSKNSTQLSSFQLLAALLQEMFSQERVIHVQDTTYFPEGDFYVIPHLANQDLFDQALASVAPCRLLFVHCNYDNGFAAESDHSLNLSRAQAEALPAQHIVFAHEHQGRVELDDKVVVIGNQWPSSISDCLNNDTKSMLKVTHTSDGPQLDLIETWRAAGDYSEQDWRSLTDTGSFIRVVGDASAAEAAKVVQALAKFRSKAQALVMANAVRIEGMTNSGELVLTHEEVTNFNVREALRELLSPEQNEKIDQLLEKRRA